MMTLTIQKQMRMTQTVQKQMRMTLTVQQQMRTMKNPSRMPALPTSHTRRMKRITPNMFWMQGKYTPRTVPSLAACQKFHKQYTSKPSSHVHCYVQVHCYDTPGKNTLYFMALSNPSQRVATIVSPPPREYDFF